MTMHLKSAVLLLGALSLVACNGDGKKDKKIEGGSHASGFALKAELCGAYTSVGDFSDKEGSKRQMSIELAMAVCGNMENSDTAKWSALGMVVSSPDVYLKKSNGAFDATEENKGELWIENESKVVAKFKNGKSVAVGTVDAVRKAAKVKLNDGVAVELAIGNRLYQISDAKTVPDSEKKLFISTDQ